MGQGLVGERLSEATYADYKDEPQVEAAVKDGAGVVLRRRI